MTRLSSKPPYSLQGSNDTTLYRVRKSLVSRIRTFTDKKRELTLQIQHIDDSLAVDVAELQNLMEELKLREWNKATSN